MTPDDLKALERGCCTRAKAAEKGCDMCRDRFAAIDRVRATIAGAGHGLMLADTLADAVEGGDEISIHVALTAYNQARGRWG